MPYHIVPTSPDWSITLTTVHYEHVILSSFSRMKITLVIQRTRHCFPLVHMICLWPLHLTTVTLTTCLQMDDDPVFCLSCVCSFSTKPCLELVCLDVCVSLAWIFCLVPWELCLSSPRSLSSMAWVVLTCLWLASGHWVHLKRKFLAFGFPIHHLS